MRWKIFKSVETLRRSRANRLDGKDNKTKRLNYRRRASVIAFKSLLKGLDKLVVNEEAITNDLDKNWAVIAEAIQTVLRREGYPKPYEALKELTRNNEKITKEKLHKFICTLKVSDKVKKELKKITPFNYTGI